ncbi:hypothetical protein [Yoonia sp. SDW83-1]|uniref:hypothetical protein n=1 Tax=Yoonia sp. SDW83-1 TaxID=3366945 RepID=UPI00398C2F1D
MTRYAVIRVPTSGPPALIAAPNVFVSAAEAAARVAAIEQGQLKQHHTYLDVVAFDGPLAEAMAAKGIQI